MRFVRYTAAVLALLLLAAGCTPAAAPGNTSAPQPGETAPAPTLTPAPDTADGEDANPIPAPTPVTADEPEKAPEEVPLVGVHTADAAQTDAIAAMQPLLDGLALAFLHHEVTDLEDARAAVMWTVAADMAVGTLRDAGEVTISDNGDAVLLTAAEAESIMLTCFPGVELPAIPDVTFPGPVPRKSRDGFIIPVGDYGDREFGFAVTAFARRRDGTWVLEGQIYDGSSLGIDTVHPAVRVELTDHRSGGAIPCGILSARTDE